ncbi:hypothetical protein RB195_023312 [Necator americanus]|uniref:Uncharacterized protein n=1 Tax=Necator americanus TaxID=51031 RepID=A0ABR1EIW7_NECAM
MQKPWRQITISHHGYGGCPVFPSFDVELRRLGGEESPKVIFKVVTIIVALLFQVMLKRSEEVIAARGQIRAVRWVQ